MHRNAPMIRISSYNEKGKSQLTAQKRFNKISLENCSPVILPVKDRNEEQKVNLPINEVYKEIQEKIIASISFK